MAATGPWAAGTTLTPTQANQLVLEGVAAKPGLVVVGTLEANSKNAVDIAKGNDPPYLPDTQIVQVVAQQPTKMVRLYTPGDGGSRQAGSWVAPAEDIVGLSAAQIASKYSLPQVPTMITDVNIPAGTTLEISIANPASPKSNVGIYTGSNGGGGGVQYQIKTDAPLDLDWFKNERALK